MFTGQHHYFDGGEMGMELYNARNIIVGNNPVLKSFKANGYELNLILQHRYLLLNYPNLIYDRSNITHDQLSFLPDYAYDADFTADFLDLLEMEVEEPQFFFVEILEPGHITNDSQWYKGEEIERADYQQKLQTINGKLETIIDHIITKDPNGIILLVADHAGFLGFDHSLRTYKEKIDSLELKQTIFSALLAVRGPEALKEQMQTVNSSIAVFPVLFSYLTDHNLNVEELDQSSYQLIRQGEHKGVWRYFDDEGNAVEEKLELN
jgi:hypothetical protein